MAPSFSGQALKNQLTTPVPVQLTQKTDRQGKFRIRIWEMFYKTISEEVPAFDFEEAEPEDFPEDLPFEENDPNDIPLPPRFAIFRYFSRDHMIILVWLTMKMTSDQQWVTMLVTKSLVLRILFKQLELSQSNRNLLVTAIQYFPPVLQAMVTMIFPMQCQ